MPFAALAVPVKEKNAPPKTKAAKNLRVMNTHLGECVVIKAALLVLIFLLKKRDSPSISRVCPGKNSKRFVRIAYSLSTGLVEVKYL